MNTINLALFQTRVHDRVEDNLAQLEHWLQRRLKPGTDLVLLPEIFVCPYDSRNFPIYAEERGGPTYRRLADMARRYGIWLCAGSVPELEAGSVYNTSYVFDRKGNEAARHRKVHLFNVDIEGGIRFMESETLTPGDEITVFDTEFGRIGLMICFDIRLQEQTKIMGDLGARLILVPAAFNMTTGPAHWDISFRARAMDNQLFLAGCSPARDMMASYHSWAHSIVTGPFGNIMDQLDEKEGVLDVTIDLDECDAIRTQLPILSSRRRELYARYEK